MGKTKVLCVDDEPRVLEGLALQLRRGYEVSTATSGAAGLECIESNGPFAVVLSDMRMPKMDGATFLAEVRKRQPDSVRMLLTGHTELQSAITAINEGQIFRFLTKPCAPDVLRSAFDAARNQYRLINAERVLLEQTLRGSIQTLTDILSMTNPVEFGRATRLKNDAAAVAKQLDLPNGWEIEVAAMLSQLGSVSLPEETAERFYNGEQLTEEEQAMIDQVPKISVELLKNIPRLGPVREMISAQNREQLFGAHPTMGAKVIDAVQAFDELQSCGCSTEDCIDAMRARVRRFDMKVLDALATVKSGRQNQEAVREIPMSEVRVGMVFADDVRTNTGMLLVPRGFEVTSGFLAKARSFRYALVNARVRVIG